MKKSLTFKGVQQHFLPDVLIHLPLRCKAGVLSLQKHAHCSVSPVLFSTTVCVCVWCVFTDVCDQ